jgi:hypothetical protein
MRRLVELRGASYRTRHLKRAEADRSPLREGARISGNQVPDFPEPTGVDGEQMVDALVVQAEEVIGVAYQPTP